MGEQHDIFRDSQAIRTIQQGIPSTVESPEVRKLHHAYRDIFLTLASYINEALDDLDEVHAALRRRNKAHARLKRRLFDSQKGVLITYAKRSSVNTMIGLLLTSLGALVVACILLALNLATGSHP